MTQPPQPNFQEVIALLGGKPQPLTNFAAVISSIGNPTNMAPPPPPPPPQVVIDMMPIACTVDSTGKSSVLRSTVDPRASQAQKWFADASASVREAAINNICNANPTFHECKCANRGNDPDYRAIKPGSNFNDGCWFTACSGTDVSIHLPSSVDRPSCPTTVCQSLQTFVNNSNVPLVNNTSIACNFVKPVKKPCVIL